jgi:bifunctional enzyme CysN/CysC
LHDCQLVYEDQLESLARDSHKTGKAGQGRIDFALLTDGLLAEREQGITIDVAWRYFATPRRQFILADTPGHEQYTRTMVPGASTCELAVILIDARHGVTTQTRRHSFLVSLLGVKHVVVAINKMDLVGWSQEVYERIRQDYGGFAAKLEFVDLHFIPVSALEGDNVVHRSERLPWYEGSSLLHHLETVHVAADRNLIDLRFPVQYVLRPHGGFRGFAGTVASGILRPGDEVMVLPSRRSTRVRQIVTKDGALDEAFPPMAIVVTLEDEVDVARGDVLVHPGNVPAMAQDLDAMLVWMAEEPLRPERQYLMRIGTATVPVVVPELRYRIDMTTLRRRSAERLELNEIARVAVSATRPVVHDAYARNRRTGCFVLIDRTSRETVAAGMISGTRPARRRAAQPTGRTQSSLVSPERRAKLLGQPPLTVWLTGLAKSGKSSIAYALERRLIDAGRLAKAVDGAELRHGINKDLGFSADDRRENVRRAAAIARLLNDTGVVVVAAFVSPLVEDRRLARETIGGERFVEVFCDAPLAVCESRDQEGAYARARAGELPDFPGISAPYEPPQSPDLHLRTDQVAVGEAVERIVALLRQRGLALDGQ